LYDFDNNVIGDKQVQNDIDEMCVENNIDEENNIWGIIPGIYDENNLDVNME